VDDHLNRHDLTDEEWARLPRPPPVVIVSGSRFPVTIDCLAGQGENLGVWCGIRAGEGG